MLPLPTPVLDLLIACNLAVSLTLLIVAMYVPSTLVAVDLSVAAAVHHACSGCR